MAFQAALWDPLGRHLADLRCWKAMKSEDVIVKSEGTLHTSPFDNQTGITYCTLGSAWWIAKSDRVHYVRFRSGDLQMLCWVYIVDGVRAGRCAASAAATWAPSCEESLK